MNQQTHSPQIPAGTQRAYWCRVLNVGASRPCNRLLVFCNAYVMPLSDNCDEPPACAVPHGDEYSWTGWVEESCEQCDTYWTFTGAILQWMELPETDAEFAERPALLKRVAELEMELGNLADAVWFISD